MVYSRFHLSVTVSRSARSFDTQIAPGSRAHLEPPGSDALPSSRENKGTPLLVGAIGERLHGTLAVPARTAVAAPNSLIASVRFAITLYRRVHLIRAGAVAHWCIAKKV